MSPVCHESYLLYVTTETKTETSEQTLLISFKNLKPLRGLEGQRVVLHGLSKQDLNGQEATCGAFAEDRGRYAVTLDASSGMLVLAGLF
jgi:hypothetical protein